MKKIFYILFCLFFVASIAQAQPLPKGKNAGLKPSLNNARLDTNRVEKDTDEVLHLPASPNGLDAKVEYDAKDSIFFDITKKVVYLYGDANVRYKDLTINAAYIQIDLDKKIATAEYVLDSLKRPFGQPKFKSGSESFGASKMRYNFDTRKGIVFGATTKQGELFVTATKTKYIGKENAQDTTQSNIIYNSNAILTTCDAPHPHFGIRSQKQKVIENKVVVVGSSHLEIADVPLPIWLPFGFFPISKVRHGGLIFPRDYQYSPAWGFGLRDVGYYFPLSEHADLKVLTDFYLNGSFGVKLNANYNQRYKFTGTSNLAFSRFLNENSEGKLVPQNSFDVNISINQDSKAHPYYRYGGRVQFQTSGYRQLNYNDAARVLNNQTSSTLNFTRLFPGKPYTLNTSMSFSQNTSTKRIDFSFPNIDFPVNRIYPFKNEKRGGAEKWFDKISFQYTGNAQNRFATTDTTIFTPAMFNKEMQAGIKHALRSDAPFRVLKYFNLSPQIDYDEIWYFTRLNRTSELKITENTTTGKNDTTNVFTDNRSWGFYRWWNVRAGISLNTQIFGTKTFRKGVIRGIRHVIKPDISFAYTPSTYRYFDSTQVRYPTQPIAYSRYSIFENGAYGAPSYQGANVGINYSINNIFELKYKRKRDTIDKKLKLLENIYINGNYNFIAPTLKWSEITMSGTTRLFKDMTTFNFTAVFDPYQRSYVYNGTTQTTTSSRINVFNKGFPIRFDRANFTFYSAVSVRTLRQLIKSFSKKTSTTETINNPINRNSNNFDIWTVLDDIRFDHNIVFNLQKLGSGKDSLSIPTNSFNVGANLRLDLPISKNWRVNIRNIGYDLQSKRIVYPDLVITRDLHCWEMAFSWQPARGTFDFHLRVKPQSKIFNFIDLPFRKSQFDVNQSKF